MGLFDRLRGKSAMADPVRGTARVIRNYDHTETDAVVRRVKIRLSVSAEGLQGIEVEWTGMVKFHKDPRPGTVLPVTVDRANPENLEIHWDEAPNVVQQWVGGTEAQLTADQWAQVVASQAQAQDTHAAIMEARAAWKRGEIDKAEYKRREKELLYGNRGE